MIANSLLMVKGLCTYFPIRGGLLSRPRSYLKAVDEVDFEIKSGEIVSVVGESGCGKSTLGLSMLGLYLPTAGEIIIQGKSIDISKKSSWKPYRKKFQVIFQDPYSSLNPRLTVFELLSEPMRVHGICDGKQAKDRVAALLKDVGMSPDAMVRFPHAFSGGQRQRLAIARVLGIDPDLIVCDEIVSALDVSVQAQIIQLLLKLKEKRKLSLMFISHDMSLVKSISDRVFVMYLGRMAEVNDSDALFSSPRHPYTQVLMDAIPTQDRTRRPKAPRGEMDRGSLGSGCSFYPRCSHRSDRCRDSIPRIKLGESAACFHPLEANVKS